MAGTSRVTQKRKRISRDDYAWQYMTSSERRWSCAAGSSESVRASRCGDAVEETVVLVHRPGSLVIKSHVRSASPDATQERHDVLRSRSHLDNCPPSHRPVAKLGSQLGEAQHSLARTASVGVHQPQRHRGGSSSLRAAIRATPGHLHSLLDQAVMSWLKRGERVVHSRQATGTMPSYCAVPTAAGHIGGGAGTRLVSIEGQREHGKLSRRRGHSPPGRAERDLLVGSGYLETPRGGPNSVWLLARCMSGATSQGHRGGMVCPCPSERRGGTQRMRFLAGAMGFPPRQMSGAAPGRGGFAARAKPSPLAKALRAGWRPSDEASANCTSAAVADIGQSLEHGLQAASLRANAVGIYAASPQDRGVGLCCQILHQIARSPASPLVLGPHRSPHSRQQRKPWRPALPGGVACPRRTRILGFSSLSSRLRTWRTQSIRWICREAHETWAIRLPRATPAGVQRRFVGTNTSHVDLLCPSAAAGMSEEMRPFDGICKLVQIAEPTPEVRDTDVVYARVISILGWVESSPVRAGCAVSWPEMLPTSQFAHRVPVLGLKRGSEGPCAWEAGVVRMLVYSYPVDALPEGGADALRWRLRGLSLVAGAGLGLALQASKVPTRGTLLLYSEQQRVGNRALTRGRQSQMKRARQEIYVLSLHCAQTREPTCTASLRRYEKQSGGAWKVTASRRQRHLACALQELQQQSLGSRALAMGGPAGGTWAAGRPRCGAAPAWRADTSAILGPPSCANSTSGIEIDPFTHPRSFAVPSPADRKTQCRSAAIELRAAAAHSGRGLSAMAAARSRASERSHEENQERAYIAASRRTDRSLEARVQSAHMASDIHKKRTGRSFRITEAIVMNEEMYEEEEETLPRSFRLLAPHLMTESPDVNNRLQAFMDNKYQMSNLLAKTNDDWRRENEINRMFAAAYPHATLQANQLSNSMRRSMLQSQSMPRGQTPQTSQAPYAASPSETLQAPHGAAPSAFENHGQYGASPAAHENQALHGASPSAFENHGRYGASPAAHENHGQFGASPAAYENHSQSPFGAATQYGAPSPFAAQSLQGFAEPSPSAGPMERRAILGGVSYVPRSTKNRNRSITLPASRPTSRPASRLSRRPASRSVSRSSSRSASRSRRPAAVSRATAPPETAPTVAGSPAAGSPAAAPPANALWGAPSDADSQPDTPMRMTNSIDSAMDPQPQTPVDYDPDMSIFTTDMTNDVKMLLNTSVNPADIAGNHCGQPMYAQEWATGVPFEDTNSLYAPLKSEAVQDPIAQPPYDDAGADFLWDNFIHAGAWSSDQ
ncbi:uncharacterized protein PCL_10770 [Purpureocillium lilacinum]|uniref:Uncharacterized protein n=1 Tax=Purpureocillium lilacinum TaxID=33203 RepID=A0A2U3ECB2_PURLI|nr:uncharacterized protein PCL_10770 [Purpureocillium lilacinum]